MIPEEVFAFYKAFEDLQDTYNVYYGIDFGGEPYLTYQGTSYNIDYMFEESNQ